MHLNGNKQRIVPENQIILSLCKLFPLPFYICLKQLYFEIPFAIKTYDLFKMEDLLKMIYYAICFNFITNFN